jgi:citrate lyase beta subunit
MAAFPASSAFHPIQPPMAHTAFSPGGKVRARARGIVFAHDAAVGAGKGAMAVDGRLVGDAPRNAAEATRTHGPSTSRGAHASVGGTERDGGQ